MGGCGARARGCVGSKVKGKGRVHVMGEGEGGSSVNYWKSEGGLGHEG